MGNSLDAAALLGLALAMSSTALVLPIAGTNSPVGKAAFAMLLFEDLALVPCVPLRQPRRRRRPRPICSRSVWKARAGDRRHAGRRAAAAAAAVRPGGADQEPGAVPRRQPADRHPRQPGDQRHRPVADPRRADRRRADRRDRISQRSRSRHRAVPRPGARRLPDHRRHEHRPAEHCCSNWPQVLAALALCPAGQGGWSPACCCAWRGRGRGSRRRPALLMASPSETTLILLGAGAAAGLINPARGHLLAGGDRARADRHAIARQARPPGGAQRRSRCRRGRRRRRGARARRSSSASAASAGWSPTCSTSTSEPYLAVDSDIDAVLAAREEGYDVLFGDVARMRRWSSGCDIGQAGAIILTMDDPVLVVRLTRSLRDEYPDLPIIARARDTDHAARLYRAGVTDAVPETLEASLQLSEAVLVDIGVAMGPVIASIHEKRSQLRAEIMEQGELTEEPTLGRRRLRDAAPQR